MKHTLLSFLLVCLTTLSALAQGTFSVKGRVLDKVTGEGLPGATVQVSGNDVNTGTGTEVNGSYAISGLKPGTYVLRASFIGYKTMEQRVTITSQNVTSSFSLAGDNATLNEVQVVGSLGVAVERSTPVAFSAVNEVKLRETLSNRDLPMILNETPGVYATQGGGGTGDSRINIRGFDQRNVAVMINGVPVNDMENGSVFWSNWDLGDVTKSLQVQRGLSASKISVPSVGGTINVLTRGFDDKKAAIARTEIGSYNYRKYSLMLSSGVLKNDWAFTVYGSRRTGEGWVENAYDDAWTYFGNISKKIGNHRLSLTGMGSPQKHGQRSTFTQVGAYSNEKARELGAAQVLNGDRGFRYNPDWGVLNRYTLDASGQRQYQGEEVLNTRSNYYHKPQINLNDYWQVNNKLFISTVLYASYGSGGGIGPTGSLAQLTSTGQANIQNAFDTNMRNVVNGEKLSTTFLRSNVNNHRWYGFVTGADYTLSDKLTLSAGIDGRTYRGYHYQKIVDLLGGDYVLNNWNQNSTSNDRNASPTQRLREGDKINFNYDGKTRWLGSYGQLEYKTPALSAVISGTLSQVSYKRIDFFRPRVVYDANGTAVPVPFGRTATVDGRTYTNDEASYLETPWANIPGYSVKAGANYNITEFNNLFLNVGYNSRIPFFNQVYDLNGNKYKGIRNEGVTSFEMGYGISYPSLKATLNAYYTLWSNRSNNTTGLNPSGEEGLAYYSVRNINARHMGIELSVAQEISRKVQLNAAISVGDWRWIGTGSLTAVNENNQIIPGFDDVPVYLDQVHVGDAAQNQFQLGMRIEPIRGLYVRPSFLLFTKYYAGFNPVDLRQEANRTDSYRVPTTRNLDLHAGYDLAPMFHDKVRLGIKGSVLNVLDEYFLTDLPAGSSGAIVTDPTNLRGFFNRGRTFTLGVSATL
ncbi:TonB-dependent receptor [Hymenobacter sp. BT175]|uniref:TonB-dependent receptor n=1 Tax=Hymenobacter translucens TaxID=2886507 RepID=UPI001D0EA62B|nr:TonB-dependent receptor [Hymenobacter translucens]MCC2548180.1 TonB-dependent receptor [Hymenobacter translucens]